MEEVEMQSSKFRVQDHWRQIAKWAFVVAICGLIIVACGPGEPEAVIVASDTPMSRTATPEAVIERYPPSVIMIPDGSRVIIGEHSEIGIIRIAGHTVGATGHNLLLNFGEILVKSVLPEGDWFTVQNPQDFIARVTGSIIVVSYDPGTGKFILDCLSGRCELGPDIQHMIALAAGEQGWLDGNGVFYGPFEVDLDELRAKYGDDFDTEASPSEPTSGISATATAFCLELEAEFIGTPCPLMSLDDFRATATAICQEFEQEFPGTPCP
jgi:hypothetical protein